MNVIRMTPTDARASAATGRRRKQRTGRRSGPRRERGAMLVIASLSLTVIMAFSAIAIDIGQRNQQLARAQHAIDAAVLGAAQWLSTHPADYAGANLRVKQLMESNLGLDLSVWVSCTDADHLPQVVATDTDCISYRKVTTDAGVEKHDIRVRLPALKMDTVFGSALGVESIDLAAVASSNGNNCGGSVTGPNCGPGTTTVDTTVPQSTTTLSQEEYCKLMSMLDFAVNDYLWQQCSFTRPGENIDTWRSYVCNNFELHDDPTVWWISEMYHYLWWWTGLCEKYGDSAARDNWLNKMCYGDESVIFSDWALWSECKARRPSLGDWDTYWATTTTTPTTSPPASTTTITPGPTTTVPTSIDLSS